MFATTSGGGAPDITDRLMPACSTDVSRKGNRREYPRVAPVVAGTQSAAALLLGLGVVL